jgi:hypothetical protein
MNGLSQDLRYTLRALRKARGFALTTILTLALAIGGSTTIFTAVDSVLLRPLGFANPDRLTMVWTSAHSRVSEGTSTTGASRSGPSRTWPADTTRARFLPIAASLSRFWSIASHQTSFLCFALRPSWAARSRPQPT